MSNETIYYTISTIPQVLAAIVAILASLSFFRLADLKSYLIGDGKANLARWDDEGYDKLLQENSGYQRERKRLRDATERRCVTQIKETLLKLSNLEEKSNPEKTKEPGHYWIYQRFRKTERFMKCMKGFTFIVVLISFITIALSVYVLQHTDKVRIENDVWITSLAGKTIILFHISLFLALILAYFCLFSQAEHEKPTPP